MRFVFNLPGRRFCRGIFACALLVICWGGRKAIGAEAKPNILLIVADDLGWGELGCQGNKQIPTPNIDSIAQNGVRFTNAYVSCPVCSPTRAGLMTSRYQQRFGHEFNPGPVEEADANFGLPLTETTLANQLKTAGYATGMVGKWHLGYLPQYHPEKRGFDEYFGFLGGAHPYMDGDGGKRSSILRGTEPTDEKEYLTDAFGREAVSFIDRHQKETFFLYLPFNAVHAPMQAAQKYLDRFPNITDPKRKTFAAMLSAMDDAVGSVLKKLHDAGLEEKTLVFFISDNGGPTPQTTSGNGPLHGFKGQVWDGGIREPFMIQWKGHVPAGKVIDNTVISLDIGPTALTAAGVSFEGANFEGINIMPLALGEAGAKGNDALYWRFGPQAAIRRGDWKLLTTDGKDWQLYNLKDDIGETKNLATEKADLAKELHGAWDSWNAQNKAPLWKRGNAEAPARGARRQGAQAQNQGAQPQRRRQQQRRQQRQQQQGQPQTGTAEKPATI